MINKPSEITISTSDAALIRRVAKIINRKSGPIKFLGSKWLLVKMTCGAPPFQATVELMSVVELDRP
jgi:hypothetical protein